MNKQKITIVFLVFLLLLSLSYILWQLWFKIKNAIFTAGYSYAVQGLIKTSENEKCESFPVFLGEKTVYLINIKCLQDGSGGEAQ